MDSRQVLTLYKTVGTEGSDIKGVLALNVRAEYFVDILSNVSLGENGYILLTSADNSLYSSNVNAKYLLTVDEIDQLYNMALRPGIQNIFTMTNSEGEMLLITINEIKLNGWRLISIAPENDVLKDIKILSYGSVLIAILLTGFMVALSLYLAKRFTKPINVLVEQVASFELGKTGVQFNAGDNRELNNLACGLNRMNATLNQLFSKLQEEQEMKRKAEIAVLQAQINPHFLYNTLSSIKALVDMGQNDRAGCMILLLTKYFYISVSRGREIISLREELMHVESYLAIMKMRYSTIFRYTIDIDEDELLDCEIIKLSLQPLVENAIYHGIKNGGENHEVIISVTKDDNRIIIEIFDDGAGIESAKLIELQGQLRGDIRAYSMHLYGLLNVNNRLRLHYGSDSGLWIDSVQNEYTVVTLTLPCRLYEKEEDHNV